MKVVLSNKAHFNCDDPELWDRCCEATTYQVFDKGSQYPKIFKNSAKVTDRQVWIPVTRYKELLRNIPLEIIERRAVVPAEIPKPSFTLRPDQDEIFQQVEDTCIINGKPGFGKTILALAIAWKFQLKTLVVCTNTTIREMWMKEVRKFFGFEPGVIGSGKYNINAPIVVANIQTLNKHSALLAKEFGLVIVDEMHHCVATTFTNFLDYSAARYKIGLSGTLKRKDGLQVMFRDFFGDTVFSPAVNNTLPPHVHRYRLPVEISGNRNVPWALRANEVYEDERYVMHMAEMLFLYWKLGHKVLFTSDRNELIRELADSLEDVGVPTFRITGVTEIDERNNIQVEIANMKSPCVLLASQSIFSEGVSLDELSCLVIGSILNNESLMEQLAGRIQRITEDKLHPVIVDTILDGQTGINQARERGKVYFNNGWEVTYMDDAKYAGLRKIAFA